MATWRVQIAGEATEDGPEMALLALQHWLLLALAAGRLGLHPQTGWSFHPGLCMLGNDPPGLLRRGM